MLQIVLLQNAYEVISVAMQNHLLGSVLQVLQKCNHSKVKSSLQKKLYNRTVQENTVKEYTPK